jgi:AAA15 family ATPase/GTPase
MQLRFEAPHLSIKTFPSIALPDFTLITGPNGAGKSHLLNALELGKIRIDDISDFSSEIRYYDWNTLVPQETGLFTSEMLRQSKINISQTLKNLRQSQPHTFDYAKELAKSYGLPPTFHVDTREFYKIEAKEILDALGAERAAQFTQQLKSNAQNIDNWVLSHLNDDDKTEAINISQVSNIPVSALDDKHIFAENIPSWG